MSFCCFLFSLSCLLSTSSCLCLASDLISVSRLFLLFPVFVLTSSTLSCLPLSFLLSTLSCHRLCCFVFLTGWFFPVFLFFRRNYLIESTSVQILLPNGLTEETRENTSYSGIVITLDMQAYKHHDRQNSVTNVSKLLSIKGRPICSLRFAA